jgi:hypothetical protein
MPWVAIANVTIYISTQGNKNHCKEQQNNVAKFGSEKKTK